MCVCDQLSLYGSLRASAPMRSLPPLSLLIDGEARRLLVAAGAELRSLQQEVVEEARRAEPESGRVHPVGAERLEHDDEVLPRLFGRTDPTRELQADGNA